MANTSTGSYNPSGSHNASSDGIDSLKKNFNSMGEHASHLKDDVAMLGRDVADTAKAGMSAAKEQVNKGLEYSKEKGEQSVKAAHDFVVDRPLTSIAIAAGVGLVVGMLMCRGRN